MPVEAIVCHVVGIIVMAVGVFLYLRERRQRPQKGGKAAGNKLELGPLKLEVAAASLVFVVIGAVLFVFPLTSLAPAWLRSPPDPATETVYCEAVERSLTRGSCDELGRQAEAASAGEAAFNVPDEMVLGQPVGIELAVDRRRLAELEAQGKATGAPAGKAPGAEKNPAPSETVAPLAGRTETFHPKTGRFMTVILAGPRFHVTALTPASQEIPTGGQALWQWEVTGLEPGRHALNLTTMVDGESGGKKYRLANAQTTRQVTVTVAASEGSKGSPPPGENGKMIVLSDGVSDFVGSAFLGTTWAKLLVPLLGILAVAAWCVAAVRRRRRAGRRELASAAESDEEAPLVR